MSSNVERTAPPGLGYSNIAHDRNPTHSHSQLSKKLDPGNPVPSRAVSQSLSDIGADPTRVYEGAVHRRIIADKLEMLGFPITIEAYFEARPNLAKTILVMDYRRSDIGTVSRKPPLRIKDPEERLSRQKTNLLIGNPHNVRVRLIRTLIVCQPYWPMPRGHAIKIRNCAAACRARHTVSHNKCRNEHTHDPSAENNG